MTDTTPPPKKRPYPLDADIAFAFYTEPLTLATIRSETNGTLSNSLSRSRDNTSGYSLDEFTYTVGDYGTLTGPTRNEVISAQFFVLSGEVRLWDGNKYANSSSATPGFYGFNPTPVATSAYRAIMVSADVTNTAYVDGSPNSTGLSALSVVPGMRTYIGVDDGYYQTWSIAIDGATDSGRAWKKLGEDDTVTFYVTYQNGVYADSQFSETFTSYGIYATGKYNLYSANPTNASTLDANKTIFNSPNRAIFSLAIGPVAGSTGTVVLNTSGL